MEATHDDVRWAVERRLVELSTRADSASVNYVRRKCGKCLRLGADPLSFAISIPAVCLWEYKSPVRAV
jgi:hypothetical protein